MPRRIQPVRPRRKDERAYERRLRRKDERAYERRLRKVILEPLFRNLRSGLAEAAALAEAFAILAGREPPDLGTIPEDEARAHFERVNGYDRERIIQTFRLALGIDVSGLLLDASIRVALDARVAENVALIKTIEPRLHDNLRKQMLRELSDAPFDRQRLSQVLEKQFKTTGSQTRLIARDQSTKALAQFTEIRHRQIGIEEYRWLTSQDERVRPTHVANSGRVFRYDNPPPETGNPGQDIACRCVAIPIITDRDRLGAEGPASII